MAITISSTGVTFGNESIDDMKYLTTLRDPKFLNSHNMSGEQTYTFTGIPTTARKVILTFNTLAFQTAPASTSTAGVKVAAGFKNGTTVQHEGSSTQINSATVSTVFPANSTGVTLIKEGTSFIGASSDRGYSGIFEMDLVHGGEGVWTYTFTLSQTLSSATGNNKVVYGSGLIWAPYAGTTLPLETITLSTTDGTTTFGQGGADAFYM